MNPAIKIRTRKAVRRLLSHLPMVYDIGAGFRLLWIKLSYSGGDAIESIKLIPDECGLAIDVGAHRGQSAIRILKLKPHFEVIGFEPNIRCLACLRWTKFLLGSKFRYELCGLSDQSGEKAYYEPYVNSLSVAAEGTFRGDFIDQSLGDRIGEHGLRKLTLQTCTLDELDLAPAFIKINVQGSEFDVLKGAHNTIARCMPIIAVEGNVRNAQQVRDYLIEFGYRLLSAEEAKRSGFDLQSLNVFIARSSSSSNSRPAAIA